MTSTTRILLTILAAAATVGVVRTVVTWPTRDAAAPSSPKPIAAAIPPVVPPDDDVHAPNRRDGAEPPRQAETLEDGAHGRSGATAAPWTTRRHDAHSSLSSSR